MRKVSEGEQSIEFKSTGIDGLLKSWKIDTNEVKLWNIDSKSQEIEEKPKTDIFKLSRQKLLLFDILSKKFNDIIMVVRSSLIFLIDNQTRMIQFCSQEELFM